jgi:NTE family protein
MDEYINKIDNKNIPVDKNMNFEELHKLEPYVDPNLNEEINNSSVPEKQPIDPNLNEEINSSSVPEKQPTDSYLNEEINSSSVPAKDKSNKEYINLVLSGGSIRGIAHIGAIQNLVEKKYLNLSKLKAFAGTSAGALIGCLVVLKFDIKEIWDFVLSIDTAKLINLDLLLFFNKCGIESGQIIYNLMEEILTKKTGISNINFKQLNEITGINYTIVGSCLTTKEVVYYNHINTPTFEVSLAIRISISMPGFFIPVTINDKKYIDGAILDNYPMDLFKNELDQTIGIYICYDYDTKYNYPEQYLVAIVNLFMYRAYNKTETKYANNTIYVERDVNISVFDFNIDNHTKHKLYNAGYHAVNHFIKTNLIN